MLKLDLFLMTYGCISYVHTNASRGVHKALDSQFSTPTTPTDISSQIIKYIDQTNINTAYVSGMKEALNFQGNELNLFATWFNVGCRCLRPLNPLTTDCIFLIPSQIFITYFRPSLWLPGLELLWGIFTGCVAACKSASPIYGLRVLIGLAESSSYPGTVTILSEQQLRRELTPKWHGTPRWRWRNVSASTTHARRSAPCCPVRSRQPSTRVWKASTGSQDGSGRSSSTVS